MKEVREVAPGLAASNRAKRTCPEPKREYAVEAEEALVLVLVLGLLLLPSD
jgi:hypothetical protein